MAHPAGADRDTPGFSVLRAVTAEASVEKLTVELASVEERAATAEEARAESSARRRAAEAELDELRPLADDLELALEARREWRTLRASCQHGDEILSVCGDCYESAHEAASAI